MVKKLPIKDPIFRPLTLEQCDSLSFADLRKFFLSTQDYASQLVGLIDKAEELTIDLKGQIYRFRQRIYEGGSERRKGRRRGPRPPRHPGDGIKKSPRKKPSERYPHAEVIEVIIGDEEGPACPCCAVPMAHTGAFEVSEVLTVVPKKHRIKRNKRKKYACASCVNGGVKTAPAQPRVYPKSHFSDELLIDIALSKFLDLTPIERYSQMAACQGLVGLSPTSLNRGQIVLAEFLEPAYQQLRREVKASPCAYVDETVHRMLEDVKHPRWYLWTFSTKEACYLECHQSRSSKVPIAFLSDSDVTILSSDDFSGYAKTISEVNEAREKVGGQGLSSCLCNAHARRKFWEAEPVEGTGPGATRPTEAALVIDLYAKIFHEDKKLASLGPDEVLEGRKPLRAIFEKIKQISEDILKKYSLKSGIAKAAKYFLKNFQKLTYFLNRPEAPLHNNAAERSLRWPVLGRKIWYGNHCERSAKAACVHFSLIQSARLSKVNPWEYYQRLLESILAGLGPITPREYRLQTQGAFQDSA